MKSFTYSGGERHIEVDSCNIPQSPIVHRIQSSEDLVDLILISEVYGKKNCRNLELVIPYFPYARQDRRTASNVAFSLKAICAVINSLEWGKVTIYDPHSDVTEALLDNVRVIPQFIILIDEFQDLFWEKTGKNWVLIAPDAGAVKKCQKAQVLCNELIYATKERNVDTGEVKRTGLSGDVKGRNCLILDDICDGGRTFVELGKELKARGAKSVELYITHGIFSQGLEVFEGIIDHIYTTDTFLSGKTGPNLTIKEIV